MSVSMNLLRSLCRVSVIRYSGRRKMYDVYAHTTQLLAIGGGFDAFLSRSSERAAPELKYLPVEDL